MKTLSLNDSAFSLVEVTLALGITAFCLIALFGLLPVGLTSNQTSVAQSGAASVATNLVADIRATKVSKPATDQISPKYSIPIPANASQTHTLFFRTDGSEAGKIDTPTTPAQSPYYRAMLDFKKESNPKVATTVRVLVTWPALGDGQVNVTPKNFTGSFETVIALDRN